MTGSRTVPFSISEPRNFSGVSLRLATSAPCGMLGRAGNARSSTKLFEDFLCLLPSLPSLNIAIRPSFRRTCRTHSGETGLQEPSTDSKSTRRTTQAIMSCPISTTTTPDILAQDPKRDPHRLSSDENDVSCWRSLLVRRNGHVVRGVQQRQLLRTIVLVVDSASRSACALLDCRVTPVPRPCSTSPSLFSRAVLLNLSSSEREVDFHGRKESAH